MANEKEVVCPHCSHAPCSCSTKSCGDKKSPLCWGIKIISVAALIGWYHWSGDKFGYHKNNKKEISVTVDVEKEAKADFVIWRLGFQNSGADVKVLREKFNKDRDLIVAFLKGKGFSDADITIAGPRMTDQYAKQNDSKNSEKIPENSRYIIGSRVKVSTTNVEAVTQAVKDVDALVRDGVLLVHSDREANPRYYLKNQTQLEQDLHADSCTKAQTIAEKIATTMGVKLGKIKEIENWNAVEILGQGQSGGGGGWSGHNERLRGPVKIAHLHQRFHFAIK